MDKNAWKLWDLESCDCWGSEQCRQRWRHAEPLSGGIDVAWCGHVCHKLKRKSCNFWNVLMLCVLRLFFAMARPESSSCLDSLICWDVPSGCRFPDLKAQSQSEALPSLVRACLQWIDFLPTSMKRSGQIMWPAIPSSIWTLVKQGFSCSSSSRGFCCSSRKVPFNCLLQELVRYIYLYIYIYTRMIAYVCVYIYIHVMYVCIYIYICIASSQVLELRKPELGW